VAPDNAETACPWPWESPRMWPSRSPRWWPG